MKKILLALTALSICLNSHALIIKGEESDYNFLKVDKVNGGYSFQDCNGDFDSFTCEPFYEDGSVFTKKEIELMARDKKFHSFLAAGADIAILIIAVRVLPFAAASAEISWALRAGYSLEGGVGATSAVATGLTVTPALTSTTMIFDALDPFVHRDLALSLEASVGNADYGDLDDIDARDLSYDKVVTVEDVTTEQVKKSFKKMTDKALAKRNKSSRRYVSPIPEGITIY